MNKYQKKLSKRTKFIKNRTCMSWGWCKWAAKRRTFYDYFKTI